MRGEMRKTSYLTTRRQSAAAVMKRRIAFGASEELAYMDASTDFMRE